MPLLTASTPVMAVQPLAKARSTSQRPMLSVALGRGGGAVSGAGAPPAIVAFQNPTARITAKQATKRYVGTASARPASSVPRRLISVTSARMPRQSGRVAGCSAGTADTNAPTPAETATLST
jgi:hypothetical protein